MPAGAKASVLVGTVVEVLAEAGVEATAGAGVEATAGAGAVGVRVDSTTGLAFIGIGSIDGS